MTMMNSTLLINNQQAGKKYVDVHYCNKKSSNHSVLVLILSHIFDWRKQFSSFCLLCTAHSLMENVNAVIDQMIKSREKKAYWIQGKSIQSTQSDCTTIIQFMAASIQNLLIEIKISFSINLSKIWLFNDELQSMHWIAVLSKRFFFKKNPNGCLVWTTVKKVNN